MIVVMQQKKINWLSIALEVLRVIIAALSGAGAATLL